ncbi:MAG: PilT/PilU family type 4a pilus ATPase [Proteobacteria bacterium]|nr:PilT/PilU family type 4a pilus ATPase [Pseudomonadota bacterium]
MQLEQLLNAAVRGGASDIILKTNAVPRFRFNGQLIPLAGGEVVSPELMQSWVQVLRPQIGNLTNVVDQDFAFQTKSGQRFRVNIFKQRGLIGIVMRVILNHVRSLEELQLPGILGDLVERDRGLILVTGATGSGKSTTLAAMIDRVNRKTSAHIITIEDPMEFSFEDQLSVIEQREVGLDTESFAKALRAAMRQNPDIIMVGELRDRETMQTALQAAETGHLVLATMHTADAAESIQRIMGFFDQFSAQQMRQVVAEVLVGIVSQRLVPRADKVGMLAAIEILIANETIKEAIRVGASGNLRSLIDNGGHAWGMQSFDQCLLNFFQQGLISREIALAHATSSGDLELKLQGI